MKEKEKKAIENIEELKTLFEIDNKKDFEATPLVQKEIAKDLKTLLNLIDKMKNCINILDDELKERNKAINEKEIIIEKLQKENEKLKNIELKSKGGAIKISLEGILSLENKIKQLKKENFDLKDRLSWRIIYCQELEKDLFENCENFVISKDRVKEQIKKYAKLSDDFYSKWKKLSPFNEDYKNLKDKCMCCDAIVDVLQKLLKG